MKSKFFLLFLLLAVALPFSCDSNQPTDSAGTTASVTIEQDVTVTDTTFGVAWVVLQWNDPAMRLFKCAKVDSTNNNSSWHVEYLNEKDSTYQWATVNREAIMNWLPAPRAFAPFNRSSTGIK